MGVLFLSQLGFADHTLQDAGAPAKQGSVPFLNAWMRSRRLRKAA